MTARPPRGGDCPLCRQPLAPSLKHWVAPFVLAVLLILSASYLGAENLRLRAELATCAAEK